MEQDTAPDGGASVHLDGRFIKTSYLWFIFTGCDSCNKLLSQAKASLRNCLQSGLVGFFDDQQMKMKSIILTLRRSSRMQNAIQNTFHEILSSRFQTGNLFSLVFCELIKFHVNSSYFSYYTKNSSN